MKLKEKFPRAIGVRWEGECDSCHKEALWSFQQFIEIEGDEGYNREHCGYFCEHCWFSNAGSREKYHIDDF